MYQPIVARQAMYRTAEKSKARQQSTYSRIIDPVISSVDSPNRLPTMLVRLPEPRLHLSGNLVHQRFGGRNIYQDAIIVASKNFLHGVERYECLSRACWCNDE